ncbi:hypothetical protein [Mycoplasma sp. VS30B]
MKRYFYTYHTGDKEVNLNVFDISEEKYEELDEIVYTAEDDEYTKMMNNNIFHCNNCYCYICDNFLKNNGYGIFKKDHTKMFEIILGIKSKKLLTTNELEDGFRYVLENRWKNLFEDLYSYTTNRLCINENIILQNPWINKIDLINLNNELEYMDLSIHLHPRNIGVGATNYNYYNNAVKKLRKNQLFEVD